MRNKKERKWVFLATWGSMIASTLLALASFMSNISKTIQIILLIVWAFMFVLSVIVSQMHRIKQNKIDRTKVEIQSSMIKIARYALADCKVVEFGHSFQTHKDKPEAQEPFLSTGDEIVIISDSLTYDLDCDSIKMIASSLGKGVVYEYHLEDTHVVKTQYKKLRNSIVQYHSQQNHMPSAILNKNLKVYFHPVGDFLYSLVMMHRENSTDVDHLAFYFTKNVNNENVLFETLFDNRNDLIEEFVKIRSLLMSISTKIDERDIL